MSTFLYIGETVSFEEKGVWILLTVAVGAYAVYLFLILGGSPEVPLTEREFAIPMLWTIGGAIVAGIVLTILTGIITGIISRRGDVDKKDARDRQIEHFGERVGQSFVVIGGVGALLLAMVEAPYFWIANALYLGFVLSGILGGIAKLVAYRRGLPASW